MPQGFIDARSPLGEPELVVVDTDTDPKYVLLRDEHGHEIRANVVELAAYLGRQDREAA
jgi:hypothetical protein